MEGEVFLENCPIGEKPFACGPIGYLLRCPFGDLDEFIRIEFVRRIPCIISLKPGAPDGDEAMLGLHFRPQAFEIAFQDFHQDGFYEFRRFGSNLAVPFDLTMGPFIL